MRREIMPFVPVADAIARLLGPNAEVVLHDLAADRVAYIVHPISGRQVGDESLLDMSASEGGKPEKKQLLFGPFEKAGPKGERLRSVSSVLTTSDGDAVGLLCINFDLSHLERAHELLASLFPSSVIEPRPEALFRRDWKEEINLRIREFLQRHGLRLSDLSAAARASLLSELDSDGILHVRRAPDYIAKQLGISRATLYSDLSRLKSSPASVQPRSQKRQAGSA